MFEFKVSLSIYGKQSKPRPPVNNKNITGWKPWIPMNEWSFMFSGCARLLNFEDAFCLFEPIKCQIWSNFLETSQSTRAFVYFITIYIVIAEFTANKTCLHVCVLNWSSLPLPSIYATAAYCGRICSFFLLKASRSCPSLFHFISVSLLASQFARVWNNRRNYSSAIFSLTL